MNKKRAFTLIELLVVIAIIAILAAILFPVFGQAKLAAKKAASLSNAKQITLAEIMYQNDYDDEFVLSTQNFTDSQCGAVASGSFMCYDSLSTPELCWPLLLQTYIKTLGLFVDPGTGDPSGVFTTGGPAAVPGNWNLYSQYGYNFAFLSPMDLTIQPTGYAFPICGAGRISTAAANPAGLVMFVSDQGFAVTSSGAEASSNSAAFAPSGDWDFLIPPGVVKNLVGSTVRFARLGSYSAPQWVSSWVKNTPIGPLTANTRAVSPYNGAITTFSDGHAKSMTADALAAGTDYGTSNTTEGSVYGSGTGSEVTNINNFLWTLDGTLNDVN